MKQSSIQITPTERLLSLDILRGLDLFILVFFQPVFMAFVRHWRGNPVADFFLNQFTHAEWEGFSTWDLVMPLFLFMVGAAMPFSFQKYKVQQGKKAIYKHIIRRVIILFVLGMVVQGNLLSFDLLSIRVYTNTLQSIAVGYFIAAVFLLHLSTKGQYLATIALLTIYWALLTFLGDFTHLGNFAEKVDRIVLGPLRDGVYYLSDGTWRFSDSYNNTWILSSMTFGVTVMLGTFAGKIVMTGADKWKNTKQLLGWGLILTLSGYLLGLQTPVIKRIWSSSMTLYAGGLSFLLMAFFYYLVDYKKKGKRIEWLRIYGMNSIVAYFMGEVINFRSIPESLLWGLRDFTGDYYSAIITFGNYFIIFLILQLMYKAKLFVKI